MQSVIEYICSLQIGDIDKYENLAIVPLIGEEKSKDYLVLEEVIEGRLRVLEQENPQVKEVDVVNESGMEIMICLGEQIIGGGQNRQVAANIYLAKDFKGKLPVQCTQHGRWNPTKEREFTGYGGYSPSSTRLISKKGQQAVWNSITDAAERTQSFSGTESLSEISGRQRKSLEEYTKQFSRLPNQIGLVAVIGLNGKKMLTADIFDTQDTMTRHYEHLIESYALDAIGRQTDKVEITPEEIKEFLDVFKEASYEQTKDISLGTDYTIHGKDAEGTTLIEKRTKGMKYASITRLK